jgi:hypothetical protein
MKWADRRRFLKAVGPLRITAVLGGLIVFGRTAPLLLPLIFFWQRPILNEVPSLILVRLLTQFLINLTFAYGFWLQWRLADVLVEVAGGTHGSMQTWSEVQLRAAITALAGIVLSCFSFIWGYLEIYVFNIFSP